VNPLAALVLAAGARLVDALLPGPGDGPPRRPDDPGEVRDRVLRAVALAGVLLVARRAGRWAGRAGRGGGRPGRARRTRR
jgi:hypothetical protein